MKKLFLGVVVGSFLPVVGAFLFIKMGGMPVATAGDPLPFERAVAGMALHAALKGHIDNPSPVPATEGALTSGARVYAKNCAVCHGRPGQTASAIAKGLFPKPPQLFDAQEMVTDDPAGEVFWKVKNGIRLTGMPGFGASLLDEQLWQVSILLTHADKISDAVRIALNSNP